jgi:hypothetical protein
MASSDVYFHVRVRFASFSTRQVNSSAYFAIAPRFVAGNAFFNGQSAPTTIRAWLPSARVPFGTTPDGKPILMTTEWYRFFEEVADRRLGGISGPTLPTVEASVTITQTAVVNAEQQIVNTQAVIVQNAQSMLSQREVSIASGLPGATLIPTPVTDFEP